MALHITLCQRGASKSEYKSITRRSVEWLQTSTLKYLDSATISYSRSSWQKLVNSTKTLILKILMKLFDNADTCTLSVLEKSISMLWHRLCPHLWKGLVVSSFNHSNTCWLKSSRGTKSWVGKSKTLRPRNENPHYSIRTPQWQTVQHSYRQISQTKPGVHLDFHSHTTQQSYLRTLLLPWDLPLGEPRPLEPTRIHPD